tara:strand:- start:185 stop:748 length:564 start_codon:yes stop_codon:yes gene_type:complete
MTSIKKKIKKKIAFFLDRDGVINKENSKLHYQNPMKINVGAVSAIKKINKNGYLCIVVTNQSAVAKGIITIRKLESDHKKLKNYFLKHGAHIDRIYYCPYYNEKVFVGENKKYKKKSKWRKPDNGMFLQAIKDFKIDTKKSYMIGDRSTDYYAAKKTRVKFLLVGNKFIKKNIKSHTSLLSAVKTIL